MPSEQEKWRERERLRKRDEEMRRHSRAVEDQSRRMERIARGQHPDGNAPTRFVKKMIGLCVIIFVLFVILKGLAQS